MAQNLDNFDVGDKPVFTAKFYNTSDALTDPSTVLFIWQVPAGTQVTYTYLIDTTEVAKVSTGIYTFTPPTISTAGRHVVRAKGTAGLIAAAEAQVGVRISAFTTP